MADLFYDYVEGFDYFIGPAVNLLLISLPFVRFIPSVYKRRYDQVCAARDAITLRYFTKHKVSSIPYSFITRDNRLSLCSEIFKTHELDYYVRFRRSVFMLVE